MTPPPIFRAAIAELGRLLIYELGRDWLPTMQQQVMSPVGLADATFVDPMQPVKVLITHALNALALISPVKCCLSAWIHVVPWPAETFWVCTCHPLCKGHAIEATLMLPFCSAMLICYHGDAALLCIDPILQNMTSNVKCRVQACHTPSCKAILQLMCIVNDG